MHDVVVLGGLRSAIGSFGGSLAQTSPITLGATVARAALRQSALEAEQIDHVAMGHVINTEARDMYLARRRRHGRRGSQQHASHDRQPAVRLWFASRDLDGPVHRLG